MESVESVAHAVASALGTEVYSAQPVSGGSINQAFRVGLSSGDSVFVKTRPDAGRDFEAEAAGLAWLADGGARVPEVMATGADPQPWLALAWHEPGSFAAGGAEELGHQLAELHRSGAPGYGSLPPGAPDSTLRIGSVEFDLTENANWPRFYAEQLIHPVLRLSLDRGAIEPDDAAIIDRVCEQIDALAGPPEPPARLHGDLWSGNVHADALGRAWLIDPAAYGGHREIDLAMLDLFGAPGGDRTLRAYSETWPLADGHESRTALWQVLPLLVHAALFGGHYGARAAGAASRYA